jgi:ribonuclease BN (tRNA processing enzyme)
MAQLTFVGTGEAFDPDLANSSVLYQGERSLLFDCGYSVPPALWRLTRDPSLLDAVAISHRHADHSFGLPGLLFWMRFQGRTRPLELLGGPAVHAWLPELLDFAYPGSFDGHGFFPIDRRELAPGANLGPLRLTTALTAHPIPNSALRIDTPTHSVCLSGDGAPTDASRALYRGATVLVHECFSAEAAPSGHASARELLALGDELGVGILGLVHVGVEHKVRVRDLVAATRTRCLVLLPEPGDTLELP